MDPPVKGDDKKSFSSEHGPVRRHTIQQRYNRAHSENIKIIEQDQDLIHNTSVEGIIRQTLQLANSQIYHQCHQIFAKDLKIEDHNDLRLWQIKGIDDKRKLRGKKIKLSWKIMKVQICYRVVFSDKYLRFNDSGFFTQLDSANIDINLEQQIKIQEHINKTLKQEAPTQDSQTGFITRENQKDHIGWLKKILYESNKLFLSFSLHHKQPAKMIQFNRRRINPEYIIYPAPIITCWSPQGNLCITKNRSYAFNKPIIGSIHSFKNFLEDPSKNRLNEISAQDDVNMPKKKKQQEDKDNETPNADLYAWNFEQQILWSVFGQKNNKDIKQKVYFQNYNHEVANNKRQSLRYQGKKVPLVLVPNLSIYSPRLKDTYLKFVDPNYLAPIDMSPGDKLKVYWNNIKLRDIDRGIVYIVEKTKSIGNGKIDICEALMGNEFQGYKQILDSSIYFQQLFPLKKKYQIVRYLAQQKLQMKKSHQSVNKIFELKYMMVENQFFHFALEDYFKEHFQKFRLIKEVDISLGSQSNFNDVKAEEYFMEILDQFFKFEEKEKKKIEKKKKKYEKNPNKYDDPDYQRKKYLQMCERVEQLKLFIRGYSKQPNHEIDSLYQKQLQQQFNVLNPFQEVSKKLKSDSGPEEMMINLNKKRNVNYNGLGIKVINKRQITAFNFQLILSDTRRNELARCLVPLLWTKQFNSCQYEYKIIKKALIANVKIINFMKRMNKMIEKLENKSNWNNLKNIKDQYFGYNKEFNEESYGKSFIVTCKKCEVEFNVFTIRELKEKQICSRCRYNLKNSASFV